jgi:hypothetical protein
MESEIVEEAGEVVESAIKKAPRKYVGCFLIAIAFALIILALGYACATAFQKYEANVKTSSGSEVNIKMDSTEE